MNTQITMTPIGFVSNSRKQIEDDNWDIETCSVVLHSNQFTEECLFGLSEFSHVEIIFYMNQVSSDKIEKSARHPRNNLSWPKVGIFAQRGKNRPNQIGSTICKITSVQGLTIHLSGLDAIDGTPVLDIKPWVTEFAPRGQVYQPQWISELMRNYWGAPNK